MFLQLRGAFYKTPILKYFNFKKSIRVETDASDLAITDILS